MKILFIGDVVGQYAAKKLAEFLPGFKRKNNIDITVINGENSANGNGITPFSANILLPVSDVITTGNHCFKRVEMNSMYDENDRIIRPHNLGEGVRGKGYSILDFGKHKFVVINLMGSAFMQPCDNPFKAIIELLSKLDTPNIIVDFHAEATGEKKAMLYMLASKVSAVLGTHTHVQTADEQIFDDHTAYITDVGMTGSHDSIIGAEKEGLVNRFLNYVPTRHIEASGNIQINAVMLEVIPETGKASSISRIMNLI
ncbi:MAG: YmdB family metallophosphoesterase [Eubacterium sp.]|jgi:metallophosphoesterase (TIGR00282 family)|nr:YmdB family metallophosphoesterase [Eubacterium sp.]